VTLRNDSPADGLPSYLIGNNLDFPEGTNLQRVSVYTPHELTGVTVDGQRGGANTQPELGVQVHSVPVELAAGQTRTVVFELKGFAPAEPYLVDVIPQPLANPDTFSLRVTEGDEAAPYAFDGTLDRRLELQP
jgi:hypothetical protein